MPPALHATLVGCAAVVAVVVAGLILARHPQSAAARAHAVYGGTVAWWLTSMAMIAGAESPGRVQLWARLAHLGIGMLPAVIYHVNVTTAGLASERQRNLRVYYTLSVAATVFGLAWPDLLTEPHRYAWGYYPAYTRWGLVPVTLLLFVFGAALLAYREAMRRHEPGSPHYRRARAFYIGNFLAYVAAIDFLPAFGVGIYPFGYLLITAMYIATMVGSLRYRLIELTPELAAERILETIPEGLLAVDMHGTIRLANGAAADLLGCGHDCLVGRELAGAAPAPSMAEAFDAGPGTDHECRVEGPSGVRYVVVSGARVHDRWGEPLGHLWLLRDLTGQRQAEEEKQRIESSLRQSQKMESLGVMAGGIAHDFNNILMAILGSADRARRRIAGRTPLDEDLQTITTSVEHAAELTDQLLTYAGRGTSAEAPVDLGAVARDMGDLLRSAVSKKAALSMELAADLPPILGDRSQMRQVILNLVTNASEALGDGPGTITLATRVARVETGEPDARPRVRLEVSDTGVGLDAETRSRMFDPFFTTKFEGRGLGLATVLGIVQRHGGSIAVESEPGRGTRFTVDLPALSGARAAVPVDVAPDARWMGHGRALLVDDEAPVRLVVGQMLVELGFDVVEAADGEAGLDAFERYGREFAVVVLDMTMPRMGGAEALAALRARCPEMPAVMISGYSVVDKPCADTDARTVFLHKPFKLPGLAARLREAMGTPPRTAHS